MDEPTQAQRVVAAARLSVVVASVLGGVKLVAALFTGSMALAASFVDSLTDVFASSVNLLAIRVAARRPDAEHPYGHGKAEGLAGMFQGSVVGFSGVFLVVESVRRLSTGAGVERTDWGLGVMALSTAASAWITWRLRRVGRAAGSVALLADSTHYASDVWMNGGVLLAFVAIRATGLAWIDPAVGLAVAALVLRASWSVLRASVDELMDRELPEDETAAIRAAIAAKVPEVRGIHELRSRRAGPRRFVELHVSVDRALSFPDAHRVSERVILAIREAVPTAEVQVHADPYPMLPGDIG
jgi:ferrous-iron efflux pump FieF